MDNSESERLAKRREVRERIARRELLRQKLSLVEERIKALDAEADQAAEVHRQATEPLQDELREIESKLAYAMANRKPIPET
jgi:predicted metal-dependent hydrolase